MPEFTSVLHYQSPVGLIEIKATETHVVSVLFLDKQRLPDSQTTYILQQCAEQLHQYFQGKLEQFSIPVSPDGTDFQKQVWNELIRVPFGETVSYGFLAEKIKLENGARAIGHANGRNPVAIIIPCHRVIGVNGKLTGYAGGVQRKQFLLDLERRISGKGKDLFSDMNSSQEAEV